MNYKLEFINYLINLITRTMDNIYDTIDYIVNDNNDDDFMGNIVMEPKPIYGSIKMAAKKDAV